MWRSGHDGEGADPSRFFCEVIGPPPSCHLYRAVADSEAEARAIAFREAGVSFSFSGGRAEMLKSATADDTSPLQAMEPENPVEQALLKDADTMLADFAPGDPGKHVQTLIPTPEWKAFSKAAHARGVSISLMLRIAARQHLAWLSAYRSPAEIEEATHG